MKRTKGQFRTKQGKRGVSWSIRFHDATGQRHCETVGRSYGPDAISEKEAQARARRILGQADAGTYRSKAERRAAEERSRQETEAPVFAAVADEFVRWRATTGGREGNGLTEAGLADLEWRTAKLLGWFAGLPVDRITRSEIEAYVYSHRSAGLSNASIAKTLTILRAILERAAEEGYVRRNVAKDVKVTVPKPQRTYLDSAAQIRSLLDAAAELDREGRGRTGHSHAMLAVLTFAGLRLGECLALTWADIDLANGVLIVRKGKTDAATRQVDLLPPARSALTVLKVTRSPDPTDLVFATSKGTREGASNVRRRTLARAVERANDRLRDAGEEEIGRISPHSLRRTYASLLFAVGVDLPTAMDQMGHATESMTLGTYARVMRRRDGERARLRALVLGDEIDETAAEPEDVLSRLRAA